MFCEENVIPSQKSKKTQEESPIGTQSIHAQEFMFCEENVMPTEKSQKTQEEASVETQSLHAEEFSEENLISGEPSQKSCKSTTQEDIRGFRLLHKRCTIDPWISRSLLVKLTIF